MNLNLLNFLVKRYSRTKTRSGFVNFAWWSSLVSIILGVVALIISLAILDGFDSMLRTNAIRFTSHIRLLTFNRSPIRNTHEIQNKLLSNIPEIIMAVPTIEKEVLIKYRDAFDGVLLKAFLPYDNLPELEGLVRYGKQRFSSAESNEIILGKMLADKIGTNVGDSIVLATAKTMNQDGLAFPTYRKFKVIGFYESGMAKYDGLVVYVPYRSAAKFSGFDSLSATSFDIFIKDITKINSIANRIEEFLGYPFFCFTFYELHSSIFAWIELQKEPIPIVLSLITIVAVFNIVTFLLINIVEKTKSIGILVTLGMKQREIVALFIQYGLKIVVLGTFIGSLLAFLFCIIQKEYRIIHLDSKIYYLNALPIDISLSHYLIVAGFTFSIGLASAIIPSVIASKIKPVQALRFIK